MECRTAQIFNHKLTCATDGESCGMNVGENRRGNQEWTTQRHWQPSAHMTHDEDKQINARENRGGNQEWTIKRHWQPSAHKTQDEDKQVNVRENQGAMKNGQSRDIGNRRHTRHRTKTNK